MTLFNFLIQGWEYFFGTMMNFQTAYPTLAFFTFLTILIAVTYMLILNIKYQKPMREIFDIKSKQENPSKVILVLEFVIVHTLLFPVYVLSYLATGAIKTYFYFAIKRIESKYRE